MKRISKWLIRRLDRLLGFDDSTEYLTHWEGP